MFIQNVTVMRFFCNKDRVLGNAHFDIRNMEPMSVEKEWSRNVEDEMKIHSQAFRRWNYTTLR